MLPLPLAPVLQHTEALILGGGLAGPAAAILLARAGRRVTLVEQHAHPHHKVCGEFLSTEALGYLQTLNLNPIALGAVPITHVRLATGAHIAASPLPFPALSLTRRTLDEALLHLASQAGAHILRGHRAESLTPAGDSRHSNAWQATLASGQTLTAPQAILATGKHDLRAFPRPPGRQNHLLAFKQYFTLTPTQTAALDRHVELHLFPGGYAGLQPVEPDPHTQHPRANLCLVIDQTRYRRLGNSWPALLHHITQHSPHLRDRLPEATPLLPKPLALAKIPYGLLLRDTGHASLPNNTGHASLPNSPGSATLPASSPDTLWRLGDQTAVIPSFTGDGMSIALHTAFLAASHLLAGHPAHHLQADLHRTLQTQIRRATTLSQLLLTSFAQPLAALATPILPHLLRYLAQATRIPPPALLASMPIREKIAP